MRRIPLLAIAVVTLAACSSTEHGRARNNCVANCDVGLDAPDARRPFEGADPADWTSFRNGPRRTGYAPEATVGDTVELVWKKDDFMVRDWTAVKPSGAVWGETLYYPSDQGTLYAFDRMTGAQKWARELIDRAPGIHSSPNVTASTVMVGTYAGNLHCLDRKTGDEIWRYRIGNVIGASPVYVAEDNAVYISHETPRTEPYPGGGYVTKNDPRTGDAIWVSEKIHHWPHSSVGVDPDRHVAFVGSNDGVLHAYDTDSGETLWEHDFEKDYAGQADIKTTPAIAAREGFVIFGTWDRHLYAYDIGSGEEVWSYDTGGQMQGSPAIDDVDGVVYQGAPGSPSIHAIDLETGTRIWAKDIGHVSSSPSLSGDRKRIVVGSADDAVVALEADTGDRVWEFQTDGPVTASPTLVGDMIYVAARKGSLYALQTK